MKKIVLFAALVSLITADVFTPSSWAQSTSSAPRESARAGREAFRTLGCSSCHGLEAQGVDFITDVPRLGPPTMPYVAFLAYTRNPRGPFMPPYSAEIATDQQMSDIYAFLRSIPNPPPPDSIPALRP